ncbi:MAG: CorA family divalent cation transporter [Planctomycetia bacterium]
MDDDSTAKIDVRTVWISDLHLGTPGCQAQALLDFLRHVKCDTLYLVGDIIDGWQLRRAWYWPQLHNDVVQKILRKARKGVRVVFVPGNHDELLAGRHERHGSELAGLRRLMVRLQRLLTPEPSALTRVLSRPPDWMSADDLQQLTQANEEFSLVLRDIAALQDRIKLMQDESATKVAEENNRSLYMLTMVTVLALPINLTSGLFGMNVGGIPFGEAPAGFWWMVGLIAAFTGLIAWRVMRRLRDRGR